MPDFEDIRFYNDEEVQQALRENLNHPMITALLHFTFPKISEEEIVEKVLSCRSIQDFQETIIKYTVENVLERSSEGLSYSGFDALDKDEAYFYISTHRDIILDTSLLNYVLLQKGLCMTASAIGDNLVRRSFLMALAKLNRNFLVKRGLGPREMLQSSTVLSGYIRSLILEDKRSVWMAQREGRTKDGDDKTQQGVLKMVGMAKGSDTLLEFFGKLKIVPVSISYEFDPTDILKMPELMAKRLEQNYVKSPNEDFNSIIKGAMGQKGRIHIQAGKVIETGELQGLEQKVSAINGQLKALASLIDQRIYENYKLWPSNYIAYDLLQEVPAFEDRYTSKEKRQFERRVLKRVNIQNTLELNSYLLMYANPVINHYKLYENQS